MDRRFWTTLYVVLAVGLLALLVYAVAAPMQHPVRDRKPCPQGYVSDRGCYR